MINVDYIVYTKDGKTLLKRKLDAHDAFNNNPKLVEIMLPDLADNAQQSIFITHAQLRKLGFVKVAE